MKIDLRTGVPDDETATDYEREAEAIERQAWDDIVDGGVRAALGGVDLDLAKRPGSGRATSHASARSTRRSSWWWMLARSTSAAGSPSARRRPTTL